MVLYNIGICWLWCSLWATVINPSYLNMGYIFIAGTIIAWYEAFKVVKQLRQIRKGNVKPLVLHFNDKYE